MPRGLSSRRLFAGMAGFWFAYGVLASGQTPFVPQTPLPGGGYRIAGTVISKVDGHPLERARVVIADVKVRDRTESVITGEDGRFEFKGLPVGKYSLTGFKRGFITASYDQHEQFSTAIVTGEELQTENLMLRLAPEAIISGKVFDEFGEPVRHASVDLYIENHRSGVTRIDTFRRTQTDDQGAYEMPHVLPGTYFLSASATPWYAVHPGSEVLTKGDVDRSLDVAYPTTYYSDVTDAGSATPILVRGAERLQLDLRMNPVPALRMRFRMEGDTKNGFAVPQLFQPSFEGETYVPAVNARMVSPGVYELTGIPAGRYNIRTWRPGRPEMTQRDGIELSQDGQELDVSSGSALGHVVVRVQIQGETQLPPQLVVALNAGRRVPAAWRPVDPKGEADLQVPAGRYKIAAWSARGPYSLLHATAEGGDLSGTTLTVGAGSSVSLTLTLVSGTASVEGRVMRGENGVAGAMVVLVPKDPEMNPDLFRRDQSDLDGTFRLPSVLPGTYTVVAIEDGWDLDWAKPAVIAGYVKRGQSLEVSGTRTVNLPKPVEALAK